MKESTAPKLYELTDSYAQSYERVRALHLEAEESGGELDDSQIAEIIKTEDTLRLTGDEIGLKIVNIMRYNEERQREIAALKGEEEHIALVLTRVEKERKRLEKTTSWFENYVLGAMKSLGLQEVTDGANKVKIKTRKSTSVEIEDINHVPPFFIRDAKISFHDSIQPVEKALTIKSFRTNPNMMAALTVDKIAAKGILKDGEEIEGLRLKESLNEKIVLI